MSECGFEIPAGALLTDEERSGRVLTCCRCRAAVRVYEAVISGVQGDQGHLVLDPVAFRCGGCLEDAADPPQALRRLLDAQRDQLAV